MEPRPIFRARAMVEADLLKAFLEGEEVTVIHQSDVATGIFAARGVGRTIAVPEDQIERAMGLIAKFYDKPLEELEGVIDPDNPPEFAYSQSPIPAYIGRPVAIVVLLFALVMIVYTIWAFFGSVGPAAE